MNKIGLCLKYREGGSQPLTCLYCIAIDSLMGGAFKVLWGHRGGGSQRAGAGDLIRRESQPDGNNKNDYNN